MHMEAREALYLQMLYIITQWCKNVSGRPYSSGPICWYNEPTATGLWTKLQKWFNIIMHMIVAISGKDPNWHFWAEFIQVNCYAYIALFCAVQSGNWHLRLGALKLMAPLFCAFDRPTYWRVIPQHLADCILLPTDTSSLFSEGGFSVSITGRPWHSVGINESHAWNAHQ